ncbi:DUF3549 family protein [Alteromonas ponticola]|uniref:DUF3549 family protein n=1 Tax=Alteromonas aquimaris TaxID=2998417 RepID=A0ABT3P454_9ALTE|nr:DUF3549 family protein [Alteromonas aquimaris]MCW8107533.1 DUF3549 family protein [Alteromonas aquimaris]
MTSPADINSISEFLLHAGTNFQVFDMGRGVQPIPTQTFLNWESASEVVPRPRQQHAWFGIVFWQGEASQSHFIWFVKLPIDERGLIICAARNHFLQIVVEALGESLANNNQAFELPDNPYVFKPAQLLMAQFGALCRKTLNLPASEDTKKAVYYFQQKASVNWQDLSVQGIADSCLRLNEYKLEPIICKHFDSYPNPVKKALLESLENTLLNDGLFGVVKTELDKSDPETFHAALQALHSETASPRLQQVISQVMQNEDVLNMDTLSILAARHYTQFTPALVQRFLTLCAQFDQQENYDGALFAGFFSDLVQLPALRTSVLSLLRSPERCEILSQAIGRLFSQTQGHAKQ